MMFGLYVRPEGDDELIEEFHLLTTRQVENENKRAEIEAIRRERIGFKRLLSVLGNAGKIRVVEFEADEDPPETFPNEDALNKTAKTNQSIPPFLYL